MCLSDLRVPGQGPQIADHSISALLDFVAGRCLVNGDNGTYRRSRNYAWQPDQWEAMGRQCVGDGERPGPQPGMGTLPCVAVERRTRSPRHRRTGGQDR